MATVLKETIVENRQATEEQWLSANPILLPGEIATVTFEDKKHKIKVGDGITPFSELGYISGDGNATSINGLGLQIVPRSKFTMDILKEDMITWITED